MSTRIDVSDAKIIWDGDVGGRDGSPRTAYKIQLGGEWLWFVGDESYEASGNEFTINISSFGSGDKLSLESNDANCRKKFQPDTAAKIRQRLVDFFLGPETKSFFPFTHPKAKCIGLAFAKEWITID